MKSLILILIIIFVVFSNCTTIHNIKQNPDSFYDEFDKAAKDRKGIILLTNNKRYIGYGIKMSQDSIFWIESLPGRKYQGHKIFVNHSISASEIREIVFTKRGKGMLQGMGIGGLSGVLGGYLTGYILGRGIGANIDDTPAEVGAAFSINIGLPVGLITGAIVGAAVGSKERFVINKDDNITPNKD